MSIRSRQQQTNHIQSNNTSGVRGVSRQNSSNGWRARIKVKGKQIYLGFSLSFKDAVKMRKEGEKKYWGRS